MQIYLNQITDDLKLTVALDHDASPAGTYISPDQDVINQLDNALLSTEVLDNVPDNAHVITGTTDSKLYAIINSVKNIVVKDPVLTKKVGDGFGGTKDVLDFDITRFLNEPVRIAGTDITATITSYTNQNKEYILYSDTAFPIKYVDFPDGTTTFMFSKIAEGQSDKAPLLNKFSGLVEEPKIESSVFIERGIVNVFEPFTKLKKVQSLNEMTKFGFGYFKINKQGFNF